jgi:DDE_Tnp_1-associated
MIRREARSTTKKRWICRKNIRGPITEHFSQVHDPRVDRTKLHPLLSIFFIAIAAVICGADEWTEIEAFGKAKRKWLIGNSNGSRTTGFEALAGIAA